MNESSGNPGLVRSAANSGARALPIFLSFVQPAIDRAFPGVPEVAAPAAARAARNALLKTAGRGDAEAQLRLGYLYDEGLGVALNPRKARAWYQKAAAQGDGRAALCLGRIYYFGQGVDPDYAEAARWFMRAAGRGMAAAQANLGYMYAHGLGVACDYGRAFRWLTQAAESGESKAQSNLGLICFHRHDFSEAIRWHRAAAEQGNGPSMCNLGRIYSEGIGVPRDSIEASKWYALGALYRKDQANEGLAAMIAGVSAADLSELIRWCRLAAEGGHPRAQLLLGAFYHDGIGVPRDFAAALKWLKLSAGQGNTKSQWRLGDLYYSGTKVPRDFFEAFRSYWAAAWKNDTNSQYMVAESFRLGHGVERDLREAAKWYRRVAERGSPRAQFRLAELYESGRGVRRDLKEAALWYLIAGAQNFPGTFERWIRISRKFTAAEASRIRREAVMRWPALAWKEPVPTLQRLMLVVNEALPDGRAPFGAPELARLWSPSVRVAAKISGEARPRARS